MNADDAMDSDAAVSHGDDEAAAASSAAAQAAEQSAVAATLATLASNGAQQQQQQPPPHASPVGPNPAPLPANYDKVQLALPASARPAATTARYPIPES